jgi:flagellar hook-associated protein 2
VEYATAGKILSPRRAQCADEIAEGGLPDLSITPITLTGTSTYASDFQSILNRAVQIAEIPLTALQNSDATVLQEKTDMSNLGGTVSTLASSLQALGTLASTQALAASTSDPSVVSATATGATSAASYTINSITSLATAASETSLKGYADSNSTPVSSTGTVELTVGSQNYTMSLTNNTLVGLQNQINGLNAGVTASILTTSGDNCLSLTDNTIGATILSLTDDPTTTDHTGPNTPLLTSTNQGTNAKFQLNGIAVNQSSNNSVIPGVTLQLLGTTPSTAPVTVSLATDPSQLSSDLQTFVTNFNALNTALAAQTGTGGGSLVGNDMVTGLEGVVNQLVSYNLPSGTVQSLADLGITFNDTTGQATFNQTTFDGLSSQQVADALTFIGSPTSGLAGFAAQFTQYSDPVTGLMTTEEAGYTQTDQDLQAQITTLTTQINNMQTSLSQQLSAADSQVAQLQSQQNELTASLQGLSLVLYGQNPTEA